VFGSEDGMGGGGAIPVSALFGYESERARISHPPSIPGIFEKNGSDPVPRKSTGGDIPLRRRGVAVSGRFVFLSSDGHHASSSPPVGAMLLLPLICSDRGRA